ncbi:efflux RND transporter periplasmic adaptor subunit [Acidipila sp. 4G-K13]|uniref:Efflux RND transporter periplasmic adaptor subunit n=2 Tax=Paracidobacterium acidisoli TaxID=2303751 RepID=A0A372IT47_9BACT|nr:efflux RND transporter periplasmic adaptor subunit [Paracidobacterium acidisoli]
MNRVETPVEELESRNEGLNANHDGSDDANGENASSGGGTKWLLIVAVLGVVALGAAIYFGIRARAAEETRLTTVTERAAIPSVLVVHPAGDSKTQEIALPGNVQAFIDTPIYARTSGYLKQWYADIGAHVRQGQLLATIETPEVDQQLDQARADLKTAEANAQLAKTTAVRWQNLLKTNSVSKQETDQAVSDAAAKQATVDAQLANVHRLEQLQSFEKIYAPFDGVITARNTDIGALIAAGANTTPQELFHLAAIRKLRVFVAVPEIDASAARDGATEPVTFDEYPGQVFQGTIVRNSSAINSATRTLNVEVDIDNASGKIMPGAYAFVHFRLSSEKEATKSALASESLVIPANTLLFRAEGLRVAVVRNGKAELVPIQIGRDYGSSVEVIAGLQPADEVIVNPADSIESGMRVQIASDPQEGNAQ